MRLRLPPLRPYQRAVLTSSAVDDVTISAPQLGKTFAAAVWLFVSAITNGFDRKGRVWWWTAPTYQQARHGFNTLVLFARNTGTLLRVTAGTQMELVLTNGAVIQARSWERADNMRGPTVLGLVADEFGLLDKEAYSAMSSRRAEVISDGFGHYRWIGNVGDVGGVAERLWKQAEAGESGFACRRWTWIDRALAHECRCDHEGEPVPIALGTGVFHLDGCQRGEYVRFIDREAARMSGPQFRREYDAEWADWSELPVYTFDRVVHVSSSVRRDAHLPLDLSVDFNVDPMCWVVGQHKGDSAWALDEMVLEGGSTTRDACREFVRRYGDPRVDLTVYGDASGKARSTKSKESDYDVMRMEIIPAFRNVTFSVPSANPPVQHRVDAFNSRLMSADGAVRYHLNPTCTWGADDMARTSWKPGTRDIDKSNKNRTHWSDAEGYRMAQLYSVAVPASVSVGRVRVGRSMQRARF